MRTPTMADNTEAIAMLAIDERAAHLSHSQGSYFDGSLELLRELAVTIDVDAALPRLSSPRSNEDDEG